MGASPFDQLTEPQRECLRLVFGHHSSKEIAIVLGVTPSAVDKRIERAVQQLGVESRFAAARALISHEAGSTSDWIPSEPPDVAQLPAAAAERRTGQSFRIVPRLLGLPSEVGESGGARNKLSKVARLVVMAVLMASVAIASMALLNIGQTLSRLLAELFGTSVR